MDRDKPSLAILVVSDPLPPLISKLGKERGQKGGGGGVFVQRMYCQSFSKVAPDGREDKQEAEESMPGKHVVVLKAAAFP